MLRPILSFASALALAVPACAQAQDFLLYKFEGACSNEVVNFAPGSTVGNGTLVANFGDGIGVEKDKQGNVKFTFSDAREAQRITNEYSVAFFDTFLRNDAEARKFLDQNRYPDIMAYRNGTTSK